MSFNPTWGIREATLVFEAGTECVMETLVERDYIEYRVTMVDDDERHIAWERRVYFGQTDASHAGGANFVQAAREQERIATTIVHGAPRAVLP